MNSYLKHAVYSFLIVFVLATLISFFNSNLMFIALIAGLLAGLFKEVIWDKLLGKGTFDWKDLYFDLWGCIRCIRMDFGQ
jgi:hypothetical protein